MATFTSGAGPYTLILNANEVGGSADVGSNTSKVSWSLQMRADSAYCQWNPGPGDFEVRINGGLVWSAQNPSLWYGGMGGTLTLASGTTTVGHNSDGSKTVYCEGKYIANSTANYLPNSSTCGGNLTLTTIPRASSFSSITGNTIGGSQTINIDRKSSSFTHNLWYRIGSGNWVSIATGVGTSKTWTLPKSLNNQIPNATSLTLTYLLRTYNGGSQIGGDVTYNFKVNYSGEKPTAGSVSITYTNLFNNKFIANYSTATINYSGYAGVYGSTVKSAQVIFNGSWKGTTSYNTGKLTAGTHTFQGVVTDSRSNSSYASQQSFTCYQINNPTISINAYRSDAEGNASPSGTYITIIPTYSAHNPVGGNSIKSNSFTCTSLMTAGTAIESGSKKILSNAAVDSEYVISGTVTDQLGRSSATSIKVGTAFTIWDVRPDEKGMAFGKYSTGADKFEVAWPAYFDKDVNIGNVKINSSVIESAKGAFFNGWSSANQRSETNYWWKISSISLTSQYRDIQAIIDVMNIGNGDGINRHVTLHARVKQQNPMGQEPSCSLLVEVGNGQLAASNFVLVKDVNSTSETIVSIWAKNPVSWSYYTAFLRFQAGGAESITMNDSDAIQASSPSNIIYTGVNYFMNTFYPVGAIYLTWNDNNPSNFLGGTWVQFGQGRTLMGQGTGNDGSTSMSFTANNTGGKYNHSMSRNDIGYTYYGALLNSNGNQMGVHDHDSNMKKAKIPLLQPYITVYFWRRSA